MPPWPIAIPSSTAIVLNSSGTPPALCTAALTTSPTGFRWVWPGTNCVYELATATIGLPKSSRATPAARRSARAPAMLRPCVTVRDLSPGMQGTLADVRVPLPPACSIGYWDIGPPRLELRVGRDAALEPDR